MKAIIFVVAIMIFMRTVDKMEKNPQLLKDACKSETGAEEAIEQLQMERKLDETRLERKNGRRSQRIDEK